MPIPYNATSPQPGDLLSQSQPKLLANFDSINTSLSEDHVAFTGSVPGQHTKVSFPNQAVLPVFNPLGMVGLYSATNDITLRNELYINKTNASGVVQVPATASSLGITASPAFGVSGWTMLPSGIKLVWGIGTTLAENPGATITFPDQYAFPTRMLNAFVTPHGDGTVDVFVVRVITASVTANSFQVVTTSPGLTSNSYVAKSFSFLAIGF